MKRVLVVDDGVENRYLLTALLEGNGFQVVQASNGAEALALAREAAPDIVVTDILMPTMDGFELCRRWRMDERLKGIPFIVYTATYTEPKDEKLALALGADRFLIKPQQPEVLLRVVNEVLAEAASHPGDVVQRPRLDELKALRRHNEALIAKLEKKVHQLEDEAKKRTDVTAALQESERWFRLLAENSSDVVWSMGFDGRILYVSPAVEALLGYKPQELREVPFEKMVAPEGQALLRDEMRKVLEDLAAGRNPKHSDRYEVEMVRRDGTRVWTEISASIMWDESGKAGGFQGVLRDISGRRLLEEDRERLKLQHMQTQRLESIGRLAGGVAHDFNNLLSVIISYADFVAEEMRPEDPLRADVQEIHKAGKRAATLTRQLLAFSRKQVMELQVMDLNQTVAGLQDMLRRLIGEDIDMRFTLAQNLGSVRADPGQIEQVIVNLSVNARDAMPQGGKLIIETANVEVDENSASRHVVMAPGSYVVLAVTDTGIGMDKATQEHIFEPFFTTKPKGKGTGLGLATVYGIVKQSGGNIWVYSEPGHGSTFKIYLPRVNETPDEIRPKTAVVSTGGGETVLLVEDDEAVRRLTERILRSAKYQVLVAADGEEALALMARHSGPVHLLVTDVVMPRMSGRELADRLRQVKPQVKVLFMSGFTDDAIMQHGVLERGAQFINKPFSAADLTCKVQEVLGKAS